ncbi:mitochondrial glycine transporter A-like [Anneissia japonica]|uniref:mitochondrial glycine transporter A-like n=1 Tax=Anneissia japonica TaxID=1529436 RepID=UPI0014255602|nr:mitochondrial glycine transporter A-like [Anneissia japonica]
MPIEIQNYRESLIAKQLSHFREKKVSYTKKKTNKSKMDSIVGSPVFKSFLAGSFSGTCSTILFQPLDLVKTRLQSSVIMDGASGSMLRTFNNVVRNEHILGLWKGMVPSISRTVPGVGMYFCCLQMLKNTFDCHNPGPLQAIGLGVVGRCFAGATLIPITVVKTRFESKVYNYQSLVGALKKIYTTEGGKGLTSGLSATLLRDAPFSGLYLMFYTQTKKKMPIDVDRRYTPTLNFASGIIAGVLASTVTQPADVVKTRMQLYPEKYKTISVTIRKIMAEEGAKAMYTGLVPRCLRRTLMAAMAWTVYEQVMSTFGQK